MPSPLGLVPIVPTIPLQESKNSFGEWKFLLSIARTAKLKPERQSFNFEEKISHSPEPITLNPTNTYIQTLPMEKVFSEKILMHPLSECSDNPILNSEFSDKPEFHKNPLAECLCIAYLVMRQSSDSFRRTQG